MLIVRFLLRFLLIPLGLLAATLVMTAVLATVLGTRFLTAFAAGSGVDIDAVAMWLAAVPALSFALTLPALLAVAIAEIAAIRSWLYYPTAGALAAWLGWWSTRGLREALNEPTLMAAAGIAAGFAYWLVAGWNAGFWKPVFAPHAPPLVVPPQPAR